MGFAIKNICIRLSQLPCLRGRGQGWGDRDAVCRLSSPYPVLKAAVGIPVCSQSGMLQLVESGRYDTRDDFSVVLQPFLLNTRLPILEVRSPHLGLWREEGRPCKRTIKAGMRENGKDTEMLRQQAQCPFTPEPRHYASHR